MASAAKGSEGRGARWADLWSRFSVPIVFASFVIMRAADRVFAKRVSDALLNPTYNLVLWNMIWPLGVQLVTLAYLLPYILLLRRSGLRQYSWRFLLPGNPLASSAGPVPLLQLALFSLGDQLSSGAQGPASAFISQAMQSVMQNTNVVWVALLSAAFLGTRYRQVHYIGCILVLLSVLVGLSSKLSGNDCSPEGLQRQRCLSAYKGSDGAFHLLSAGAGLLWFGVFLASVVPSAVSSVYKQHVLQGRDVDILYASWWSGNFQILWGLLAVPLLWVKLPGQDHLAPGETFQAIGDTLSCMSGNVPHPGDESCAGSTPPLFWFGVYLLFNLSFNVLMLWLTKHLSAAWATLATVLCLDLTNVFGMVPFMAGGAAQVMSLNDWLATALASIALWIYNMEPEERRPAEDLKLNESEESSSQGDGSCREAEP